MDPSIESSPGRAGDLLHFATQLRKSAESAIVVAYRQSLEGVGIGPSDASLRVFARLVAYEARLERRLASSSTPSDIVLAEPDVEWPGQHPALREPAVSAPQPIAIPPPEKKRSRRNLPLAAFASVCLVVVSAATTALLTGGRSPVATPASAIVSQAPARSQAPAADSAQGVETQNNALPAFKTHTSAATPTRLNAEPPVKNAARKPQVASNGARNLAQAREVKSWSLVAGCSGLNFLSRAVCMNNACAQPEARRSRSCADSVKQRRIDEARRNPFLMN